MNENDSCRSKMFLFNCISSYFQKESVLLKCFLCFTEDECEEEYTETNILSEEQKQEQQRKLQENVYELPDEGIEVDLSSFYEQPRMVPTGQSTSTICTHDINNTKHRLSLPTFIPAKESLDASDFTVQSFLAKLRSGITVMKHSRCRFRCSKSRFRTLYIHLDKRSLTWIPAHGEPSSRNKKRPLLDLSSCIEIRHAMNPDVSHNKISPRFNGTSILRRKCKITNAYKSFALIFPHRTVDITALSSFQCLFLMKGFSALCFHIKVIDSVASSITSSGNTRSSSNIRKPYPQLLTRDMYGRRSFAQNEVSELSLNEDRTNHT